MRRFLSRRNPRHGILVAIPLIVIVLALSYGAIAYKDNPNITQIYGSPHSSVWLVRLGLFNCTKAKVDIELLASRLPKLKHLELHTSGSKVKMDDVTGDIKCLEQQLLQTVRLSGTKAKVKGGIEVSNGT